MTAPASSPVFRAGLLAGLGAMYVLPAMIAVIRHAETIALAAVVNCFPVAWPAAGHRLHDAAQGTLVTPHTAAARCVIGVPSPSANDGTPAYPARSGTFASRADAISIAGSIRPG